MTDVAAPPLRVGLIGLDRAGMHLIERCAVGSPFRVAAAWDWNEELRGQAGSLRVPISSQASELAALTELDVLWMAVPNWLEAAWSADVLQSNKHVISEAPFSLSPASALAAVAKLRKHARRLLIHRPRRADDDFRRALSVSQDGSLGAMLAVKSVSWGYGLPPAGVSPRSSRQWVEDSQRATVLRRISHAVDQLLLLIPQRPVLVFASAPAWFTEPVLTNEYKSTHAAWLSLRIQFEFGVIADVEVRLNSPTPLETGWCLTTECGGYANGRLFRLTKDGEVFNTAATTAETHNDPLLDLASMIKEPVIREDEEDCAITTVRVLAAAMRSLDTQQQVAV